METNLFRRLESKVGNWWRYIKEYRNLSQSQFEPSSISKDLETQLLVPPSIAKDMLPDKTEFKRLQASRCPIPHCRGTVTNWEARSVVMNLIMGECCNCGRVYS